MTAKLIVALDVQTTGEALSLVEQLMPEVDYFKVGLSLFSAAGPSAVRELKDAGASVFLDLKLHDIPAQVEQACRIIATQGVGLVTVHALGGRAMMMAAKRGMIDGAAISGRPVPLLVGVTLLTSLDGRDLESVGLNGDVDREVGLLAGLAQDAGLDGVVASPREITLVREETDPGFKIVTPGIRPAWADQGDQKRIMTPAAAVRDGSDFIVIGRPITEADDPKEAAMKVLSEMESAM